MRRTLILPLLALLALAFAAPAKAALEIESFDTTSSTSAAGGHPDLHTHFRLKGAGAPEVAKDITFDAPRGMFGNPSVLTPCSALDFALQQCPPNAQVGVITIRANHDGDPYYLLGKAPVYSLEAAPEEAARFAFIAPVINIAIAIPVSVRSESDYGLRFTVSGITQTVPVSEVDLTLWGVPADSSHSEERFKKGSPGSPAGCPKEEDPFCIYFNGGPTAASVPPLPFTGNPSVCGQSMATTLDVGTYQRPGVPVHAESSYPTTSGCENQRFAPVAQARLTTKEVDAPSGLDFEFSIPQGQTKAVSPSQLRAATLLLPDGLTINPDAADGQSSCSDQEAGFGRKGRSNCPDNSKVGTVTVRTASLPGDLTGSIYLGEPQPGNQYRLFMLADGFGIHAKFVGKLLPDAQTGQVEVRFADLPQLPFEEFEMHVFASDRGIFATPTRCSVHAVQSRMYPWNSALADEAGQFGVSLSEGPGGAQCPGATRPFHPRLEAGTGNASAGSFSDFSLRLDRDDGDQYLRDLGFTMPPGLSASLRGVAYCPDSSIASAAQKLGRTEQAIPSCPASSAIGTTNVAAGPGSHPFHAVGKMYMAGPFKGAPLSLVSITPALAGPYDYGTVVIRVAVSVDALDAHVTAISDTVPLIIGGIPLRLRSIEVNLTRPEFMLNPTNCSPMSVGSKGIGDQQTVTEFTSYFQVVNCGKLAFKPKMAIKYLSGGKSRSRNPGLEFALETRPGDANIKTLAVTLPTAFSIDQGHIGNICSEKELLDEQCAGRTPIGKATTTTPLLDQPLSGPAYAVSGSGGLPRLAFILDGQVRLVPRAKSTTVTKGGVSRLRTTVPVVPDAPVGEFRLTVFGGKTGYLVNTRGLCLKPVVSTAEYLAQNGRKATQSVKAKIPCGGSAKAKK